MQKKTIFILFTLLLFLSLNLKNFAGTIYSQHNTQPAKKYVGATPLNLDHHYFNAYGEKSIFWSLIPYYIHQETQWSCSVAATVTALNGARALLNVPLFAEDPLITEKSLIKTRKWRNIVNTGMSLNEFSKILTILIADFKINATVEKHFSSAVNILKLDNFLKETENAETIIIINFLQGMLTGDKNRMVGHYALIGAFNAAEKKVLILDPDRQFYAPYWTDSLSLLKSIKTQDDNKIYRGILILRLKKTKNDI